MKRWIASGRTKSHSQHSPQATLSALLRASTAVNSAMGLQPSLREVLSNAKKLLDADEGSVMLPGPDGHLRILVGDGIPADAISSTRIAPGDGISGSVFRSGEPLLLTGKILEDEFASFISNDRPINSAICLPLRVAGNTVGILNLNITYGTRHFSRRDLELSMLFADQAALAINKEQLLEAARGREADLSLLLSSTKNLLGELDLETLLLKLLDAASGLAPCEGGFACVTGGGKLEIKGLRGIPRHLAREVAAKPSFLAQLRTDGCTVIPIAGPSGETSRAVMMSMQGSGQNRAAVVLVGAVVDSSRLRLLDTLAGQASLAIKNAELYREVDDKEAELASIVQSLPNPVVVADPQGRLLMANTAAEDLFTFSAEFVRGQPVGSLLNEAKLEELLVGTESGPLEIYLGRAMWNARSSVIQSPEVKTGGRILQMYDVTKERELEAMKSDFVAVIGHELRTPLTAVKGYIKTLLRRGDRLDAEKTREALKVAESQANRLERLLENLLYVSRISDADGLNLHSLDLVKSVESILEEFRVAEPGRKFTVKGPDSLEIAFDRDKTDQILFHLLDNACKYSPDNSPVTVEITDAQNEVGIAIVDRGKGILSSDLPKVFDRFHQVDLTSTREQGGVGVGLYICKRFAEAQGGRIGVSSSWGKGSKFTFWIPRRDPSEAAGPGGLFKQGRFHGRPRGRGKLELARDPEATPAQPHEPPSQVEEEGAPATQPPQP